LVGPDVRGHKSPRSTLNSFAWTGAARMVAEATTFVAMLVTARAVPPSEFGRATVAIILGALAANLTQQGIGSPLVQRRELESGDIASAWVVALAVGGTATGLVAFCVAPALQDVFDARTAGMLKVASLAFVFASVGVVPNALLQRNLDFPRLAIVDGLSSVASAIVGATLALTTHTGYALVWAMLVLLAASTIGSCVLSPRAARGRANASSLRSIAGFGSLSALSGLLYVAVSKIDYAVLGAVLGPRVTSFYARGFQLGFEYPGKATAILVRIALPLMSRTSSPDELRALRRRMTSMHAAALLPFSVLLIVVAPVLVPVVLGPAWRSAIVPAQILSVAGMTATIAAGTAPLLQALGKPGAMVAFTAFELAVFAGVLFLTAPAGVVTVCWTIAAARVVLLLVLLRGVVQPIAGIPAWRSLAEEVVPALGASLPLAVFAYLVLKISEHVHAPPTFALLASCGSGLLAYGFAMKLAFPSRWEMLSPLIYRVAGAVQRLTRLRGT
jgi:O-antigen/teichoic acid export membrane protein